MNERQRELFSLFKTAIQAERSAQDMYGNLLKATDDPELQLVIERFQREERSHQEVLEEEYARLRLQFAE